MNNYIFELKGGWKYTVKKSEMLLSSHFYTVASQILHSSRNGMATQKRNGNFILISEGMPQSKKLFSCLEGLF